MATRHTMNEAFLFGKSAVLEVNSVAYDGKGWSVSPDAADLRTDNTGDQGFANRIAGVRNCSFTINFDWDASANLMDDPPALKIGSVLTGVKLHLDFDAGGPFWSFPKAQVLTTPMTAAVGTVESFTVNCANKGPFAAPVGEFTPSAVASI